MEQGFNAELYYNNNCIENTISICPISAITGEGIPDLLMNIISFGSKQISNDNDKFKCTTKFF